jgi:hypothetical protein
VPHASPTRRVWRHPGIPIRPDLNL